MPPLTKLQLIDIVRRLMESDGTEEELDHLQSKLTQAVPHPAVSDLVFYPPVPMSAEEIVEVALAYKAVALPGVKGKVPE
jgi:hypothetical protein